MSASNDEIAVKMKRIISDGDYETLVQYAEDLGRRLAKTLTTSQIRNVFGAVKQLQARYDARKLRMLKPKLAYMAARAKGGANVLREALSTAIDEVLAGGQAQEKERFQRLVDFFEATLAYHKAYGGRDS